MNALMIRQPILEMTHLFGWMRGSWASGSDAVFDRLSPRMTIRVSLRIVCEDIPRRNDRYAAIRR
ncbi:MAG: hypothetical protein J0G37_02435 [Afipia sp.]|jgi:hypothetical protein|nr:hypothetical protein [Afipia sp.]